MPDTSRAKEIAKSFFWGSRSLQRKVTRSNAKIIQNYNANHKINKLNIGCGYRVREEWLNADLRPRTKKVLQFDATKKFPLPSDHFHFVYSEHMVEHVPFTGGATMLAECFRVLRPKGKIRLATPDICRLLDLFAEKPTELQQRYINWSCENFIPEAPQPSAIFVLNAFVRKWGHTFIYDQNTLKTALKRAGFVEIVEQKISESSEPALANLESVDRIPEGFLEFESQIFEATKP